VTSGPYRWIRHPSYTGVLIFLVGWGLALQSGVSVLANIVIFAIAYGSRILFEERVLVKELGSAYVDYMKHTKRLVPHLI
jgi:protein-S-isoprenylcysteine O-methyltransferase Ste14